MEIFKKIFFKSNDMKFIYPQNENPKKNFLSPRNEIFKKNFQSLKMESFLSPKMENILGLKNEIKDMKF